MGIQVESNLVQPQIEFNRVHLLRLEITQPTFTNDELPPKYKVMVEYKMFGVDGANQRHYHPETNEVEIEDFLAHAMAEVAKGNTALAAALQSIEVAIAFIINQDRGFEVRVV
jgi:hypothetical protein